MARRAWYRGRLLVGSPLAANGESLRRRTAGDHRGRADRSRGRYSSLRGRPGRGSSRLGRFAPGGAAVLAESGGPIQHAGTAPDWLSHSTRNGRLTRCTARVAGGRGAGRIEAAARASPIMRPIQRFSTSCTSLRRSRRRHNSSSCASWQPTNGSGSRAVSISSVWWSPHPPGWDSRPAPSRR